MLDSENAQEINYVLYIGAFNIFKLNLPNFPIKIFMNKQGEDFFMNVIKKINICANLDNEFTKSNLNFIYKKYET